jgi:hypothetical protein
VITDIIPPAPLLLLLFAAVSRKTDAAAMDQLRRPGQESDGQLEGEGAGASSMFLNREDSMF